MTILLPDNGDRNKILATIVKIIDTYTRRYPSRSIYFRGAISLNIEELTRLFDIYMQGQDDQAFIPFKRSSDCQAFLVKRKIIYAMKKILKINSSFFDKEITPTIDEKLNSLKGKILAPKKLEEANKQLSKIKSFPK